MTARLLVVGDALLDRDIEGRVERLCPDSPAPVLDETDARARPGGAALAACLAATGGTPTTLVTAIAADPAGSELARAILAAGVDLIDLGLDGQTPEKIRLLSPAGPLLRLDRGAGRVRAGGTAPALRAALASADAVLVSDYGHGVAAHADIRAALAQRDRRCALVWDPHPLGAPPLAGATLVTPNLEEAAGFADRPAPPQDDAALAELAAVLAATWSAEAVCVTRGARGALQAGPGADVFASAGTSVAGDPCGAGDMFAARAAAVLAAGGGREAAIAAAVSAAGEFVAGGGARAAPLRPAPGAAAEPTADRGSPHSLLPALALTGRIHRAGGVMVATGGCFDLLHVGHARTLAAARNLGDCLVVLLNSDRSVRRLKGRDRPLVSELERATMLRALACVDEVAIFEEPTPTEALRLLRPDVWAKGGDYELDRLPESEEVASWGGRTAILPYLEGRSTTKLIEEVGEHVEG
jgi:rfaE bifunctional protein nucleotidyltransferase chain/domain/rfaE bifunctional protein kinase chain/domain